MPKYSTIKEYLSELKRVDHIMKTTQSYKLKNDMSKYKRRLHKEMLQLVLDEQKNKLHGNLKEVYIDEMELKKNEL